MYLKIVPHTDVAAPEIPFCPRRLGQNRSDHLLILSVQRNDLTSRLDIRRKRNGNFLESFETSSEFMWTLFPMEFYNNFSASHEFRSSKVRFILYCNRREIVYFNVKETYKISWCRITFIISCLHTFLSIIGIKIVKNLNTGNCNPNPDEDFKLFLILERHGATQRFEKIVKAPVGWTSN